MSSKNVLRNVFRSTPNLALLIDYEGKNETDTIFNQSNRLSLFPNPFPRAHSSHSTMCFRDKKSKAKRKMAAETKRSMNKASIDNDSNDEDNIWLITFNKPDKKKKPAEPAGKLDTVLLNCLNRLSNQI